MAAQKMMAPPTKSGEPEDRVLTIMRTFDAPRELVFEAFTDRKHLMSWWGPHGCTVISCEADSRVGGTWCILMRSSKIPPRFVHRYPVASETRQGLSRLPQRIRETITRDDSWMVEKQRGVYREVVKLERLVFTYTFEDDGGRPLHQTVVTVTFADEGGRTRLTLRQAMFETVSARNDHVLGWTEALEHLDEHLIRARRSHN
jgi:uncharacterized protein YndB with AHSA1/START domain